MNLENDNVYLNRGSTRRSRLLGKITIGSFIGLIMLNLTQFLTHSATNSELTDSLNLCTDKKEDITEKYYAVRESNQGLMNASSALLGFTSAYYSQISEEMQKRNLNTLQAIEFVLNQMKSSGSLSEDSQLYQGFVKWKDQNPSYKATNVSNAHPSDPSTVSSLLSTYRLTPDPHDVGDDSSD